MATLFRKLVSKQKKRYVDTRNGFDLDLAYVTPNIIAMGFPSSNFEALYRNPIAEVKRFLEFYHSGKYKLWSLTAEPNRKYDKTVFHGRVEESWQFFDHEAPPFELVVPMCINIDQWLKADPKNVAVIHCKAGKGRTGVAIAAYLLFCGHSPTADKALHFYGEQRTKNKKGVTIPSQKRAVYQLEQVMKVSQGGNYRNPFPGQQLRLKKIKFPVPVGGCTPALWVLDGSFKELFTNSKGQLKKYTEKDTEVEFTCDLLLAKDAKMVIMKEKKGKFAKMFHFWFHTEFIANNKLVLEKRELDKAYKDCKKHKKYASNFTVELEFTTEVAAKSSSTPNVSASPATPSSESNLVVI